MDFKRYRGKLNSGDQPFFPADSNSLVAWEWLCSWGLIYESRRPRDFLVFHSGSANDFIHISTSFLSYAFQNLHRYNGVGNTRNQFSIIISSFIHDIRLCFNPDPSFRPPSRPDCYRKKNTVRRAIYLVLYVCQTSRKRC
jgi:hypothetical protein